MTDNGQARNIFGEPLEPCCYDPLTGYFRDGFCRTDATDFGSHVVCAEVTEAFLEYTKNQGNDLSTPRPQWNFPGLKPGDRWCLCATRWLEAERDGVAPPVVLEACHEKALQFMDMQLLVRYAKRDKKQS